MRALAGSYAGPAAAGARSPCARREVEAEREQSERVGERERAAPRETGVSELPERDECDT